MSISTVLIGILIVSGLGVLGYPALSQWYNQKYQMNAVVDYDESVSQMRQEVIERERRMAREYNEALTGADIEDPFIPGSGAVLPENYTEVLDIREGIMAYIEIPAIDVYLPIYHGTSAEVLEVGAGHMEMTAFPIGGEGNHSVITGHTGLPNARMFTDLVELDIGARFYIHILDEVAAYEVDRIQVVEPDDTSALKPAEGRDYVTLVTCTPYAVNSHRLLVRGQRIPYDPGQKETEAAEGKTNIPYEAIIMAAAAIILLAVKRGISKKKDEKDGSRL